MLNRTRSKKSFKWHALILLFIFAMVVTYVWQINHQAKYSFAIGILQDEKQELEKNIRAIEHELAEDRSLASVTQRARDLALETPQDITFLKLGLSTVAVLEDVASSSP
jgi:hypothetical protein